MNDGEYYLLGEYSTPGATNTSPTQWDGSPDRPILLGDNDEYNSPPASQELHLTSPLVEEQPRRDGRKRDGDDTTPIGCKVDRWCFTLNNPGNFIPPDLNCVTYMVFQLEIAPKTGTPHLQGYVRFKMKKNLSAVRNAWKDTPMQTRCHWLKAKGTEEQNRIYCSKLGEDGRVPGTDLHEYKPENFNKEAGKQGRRTDLSDVAELAKTGASVRTIAKSFPEQYMKFNRGIKDLVEVLEEPEGLDEKIRDVQTMILWGDTDTGKTHRVRMMAKELNQKIYMVIPGRDPWGNYHYEENICFDEFDPTAWKITEMNRYCDKWPCKCDRRYNDRYLAATRIIIIANSHPHTWWPKERYALQNAFFRRITRCHHICYRTDDPRWEEEENEKIEPLNAHAM